MGKVKAPCQDALKNQEKIETLKIPGYSYYNGAFWSDYLMSKEGKKYRDMAIVLDKVTTWTALPETEKDLTKMIDEKNKEIVKFGFNTINSHTKLLQFHIKQHGIDKGSFKALTKMGKEMVALKDDADKAKEALKKGDAIKAGKASKAALAKIEKAEKAINESTKKHVAELNKKIIAERKKMLKRFETRLMNDVAIDVIDKATFSQILPMVFEEAGNPDSSVHDFKTFFYREDSTEQDPSFSFKVYERTKDQCDLGTYVILKYYRFHVVRTSERYFAFITKDTEYAKAFCASVKYFLPDAFYEKLMSNTKIQAAVDDVADEYF